MKFVHHPSLDSTNLEAGRRAEAGDLDPVWISAEIQTAGKGRRGRDWISNKGNLFCTGLYPYEGELADAAKLSFAAALALADTLDAYIDPDIISIKWPNDVLVSGRKIAGILLESGCHKGKNWIATGMGVNLVSSPEIAGTKTTHLSAHLKSGKSVNPQTMLTLLAKRFDHWRLLYMKSGFTPLRESWLLRTQGIGGAVIARLPNQTIEGIALGLADDGALELKTKSGQVVKIHAGDVFFS